MIDRNYMKSHPEIDWDVYNDQNNIRNYSQPMMSSNEEYPTREQTQEEQKPENENMVSTLFGSMKRQSPKEIQEQYLNEESMSRALHQMSGLTNPMALVGRTTGFGASMLPQAFGGAKKIHKELNPGHKAEEFRETLGKGTSTENIASLGQDVQAAKQSRLQEALKPKE